MRGPQFNCPSPVAHIILGGTLCCLLASTAGARVRPLEAADARDSRPSSALERDATALPLAFEVNLGQTDPAVDFLARGSGYAVFLCRGDAVLRLQGSTESVLRLQLAGANPAPVTRGCDRLPGTSNYFIGNDPGQWRTGVAQYRSVHYAEVYDGVDLRYYGRQRRLEYDFIIAPGADPASIRLNFQGIAGLHTDQNGNLLLWPAGAAEQIRFLAPVAFQEGTEGRVPVASRYVIGLDDRVAFEVGPYDKTRDLVIDPVLDYATYLGGTGYDIARAVEVDGSGAIYIGGGTSSTDFPTPTVPYSAANSDFFVTKLSADGNTQLYASFLGGSGTDYLYDLAIDGTGNAYASGYSVSSDLPTLNAYQSTLSGLQDAVLVKFDSAGILSYATYFGGSAANNQEAGYGLDVDAAGIVYLAGYTNSNDFPTKNAYDPTFNTNTDVFIAKFDLTLTGAASLLYSTYIGSSGSETAAGIRVDAAGNMYFAGGHSPSGGPGSDFPMVNAYDSSANGVNDVIVAKLDNTGTTLLYSTYLGGADVDIAQDLVIDGAGNIYVTGYTESGNFPTTTGAYRETFVPDVTNERDVFIAKVDPSQSGVPSLVYSTFLGGSANDEGRGIAVDASGKVYLTGLVKSADLPTTPDAHDSTLGAAAGDAFLATMNSAGSTATYLTYLGGSGYDYGQDVTVQSDQIYLAGYTLMRNFENVGTSENIGPLGGGDSFLIRLSALGVLVVDTVDDYDNLDGRWGDTASIDALLADMGSDGKICLREAITACNNTPNGAGPDEIRFDIAGAGPHTIQPGSALPGISDPVVIDGTSEPDFGGAPVVELDGSSAGASSSGLSLGSGSDGSSISGLVINRFSSHGIRIQSSFGHTIAGNYLGTDVSGLMDRGNGGAGIYTTSGPVTIGGQTAAERNVIAGNTSFGIGLIGSGTGGSLVAGNYIGLDASGNAAMVNDDDAIQLSDAPGITIGGGGAGPRNVICAKLGRACVAMISAASDGNVVQGNYMGTDATGTAMLAGGTYGVYMLSAGNAVIGGDTPGAGNLIAGYLQSGVNGSSNGTVVQGNSIGTDATGILDLSNGMWGVFLSTGASDWTVGGTTDGSGNKIANNSNQGVYVALNAGTRNRFNRNEIFSNGTLGIDLQNDGVTLNDAGDSDTGPNLLQNYPVLASAKTDEASQLQIEGSLNSTASASYRVEFFASPAADGSGYGEGKTYLGFTNVVTDGAGDGAISVVLPVAVAAGSFISATATDPSGNTSEFAQSVDVALMGAHGISGIVFEDTDFDGIATDWDGGASDVGQPGVEVELYDNADVHIVSTITDVGGNYSFTGLANGSYKVRVRSVTLGDSDSPPAGGFNATVPGTWPYPLPEMSWANTAPLIGGQDPDVDDTFTNDDAGPGDTYAPVTVSGIDVSGVNFGFSYELIVNELDDGLGDTLRSQQGSLRQFIKNANAISGTNRSQFQIPGL